MAAAKDQSKPASSSDKKNDGVSDEEVRQESSKAADSALAAQKKAAELKEAAAGAGDADERQKLMEQAIDAQVEAESFGKTAKYLRSGAFQGMAMGTGLGVAPGATLGALTGTLVGGVTSMITGGIGGGVGLVTGALHGPFVNMGEVAGKGIQKITGNLPSWAATEDQKKTLEKMMGQAHEQDMPEKEELEKLKGDAASAADGEGLGSWAKSAKDMMPSTGVKKPDAEPTEPKKKPRKLESRSNGSSAPSAEGAAPKQPRKLETRSNGNKAQQAETENDDKKPPKLDSEANRSEKSPVRSSTKGQPRKLEKR